MALSSCLLPGEKLIVAVQTLFFICSLRCGYSIRQATVHTIYSAYDVMIYTVYCATDGCNTLAITHNPEAAGSSPVPATIKTADFVRNQRFLFTFYAVLHNEQESVYGFCSLFVLYPVRTVLHFIAGYPARSRRAGFIFALCLGERVCPGGTAARPWVNTVLCGFHS